ncbi:Predicted branched-chain amino acid permease (azaleucine resistance) [Paraoerskovia marina]|uniref:Predicted branched-chain amino acid permease (Azaleucine resistance) n=1 Tax=Paraoerskovia marina TaxID=545619 RepID=A0A1H1TXL4_9CELL|nr:Predicted branched-chain amino acid permease (azaleucine resistance) [Paraoerskovia marina]
MGQTYRADGPRRGLYRHTVHDEQPDTSAGDRRPSAEERRAVVRQALSVSVATGLYGVSFGALATVAGLSLAQSMVLSLLMFSGGSQFALVGVVGSGGAPLAAVLSASFLGVRNALYGVQLSPLLALHGWRRALAAHLTIDESTAVATAQPTRALVRLGFWWTGAGVFVLWNLLVLVGAVAGDALGDPQRWGLDAAAGAAFLGLLWPRLASRAVALTVAIAAAVAVLLVPVTPAGVPVLAAAAVAIVLGQVLPRPREPHLTTPVSPKEES